MKKTLAFFLVLSIIVVFTCACSKKNDVLTNSASSIPISEFEDSSQISKNEEDGSFTFAFDPYVLPKEIKRKIGNNELYSSFVNAVMSKQGAVSMPTRRDYDNIRFAIGNNFPFAFLIENLKYDSLNSQIIISYKYSETHSEKIEEFKNTVSTIFDECVKNSDSDVLAAMSLYRYIAQNFEIVAENIKSADSSDMVSSSISANENAEPELEEDMYSTLVNRKGTASSISSLYKFLLTQLGIDSKVANAWVDGKLYSWNMVCLNSKWYHCDITKENKTTSGAGLKFFGMNIDRIEAYGISTDISTGEWEWFTYDIPKAKSEKFKEFEKVISWEETNGRESINAFTEEYSRFTFEF